MDRQQITFSGVMLGITVLLYGFMAVEWWPTQGLLYRGELGDRSAARELHVRAAANGDVSGMVKWGYIFRDISEQDMLFMEPESRRIVRMLWEAQGNPTPLLDVMDKH